MKFNIFKEVDTMKERRKFTGKEKAVLAVLIILMIGVVTAGAVIIVNNVNEANRIAADTQNTTVEYTHPETTEDNTTADSTEKKDSDGTGSKSKSKSMASKSTASKSVIASKSETASKSTASKSTSSKSTSKSKSKSSSKSSSSGKIPIYTPPANETHATKQVCTINGKKCYVGDTITMTLNLKTPVALINYQGYTTFDDSMLEFVDADSTSGALVNCKDGTIYYNASVLRGIDFTSNGTVYFAKFKVKKPGSTSIQNTFEVMSSLKDESQIPESKRVVSIEIFD